MVKTWYQLVVVVEVVVIVVVAADQGRLKGEGQIGQLHETLHFEGPMNYLKKKKCAFYKNLYFFYIVNCIFQIYVYLLSDICLL